ncbi:hypothetical protein GCM10028784_30760 [Myceligenerans cantabricum]
MARRPKPPDEASADAPHTAARLLTPILTLATALALSACSVTLNPGPGEAAFGTGEPQLGEASAPVRNAVAASSEPGVKNRTPPDSRDDASVVGVETESGTIDVRPAPEPSPDEEDGDGGSTPGQGDDADDTGDGGAGGDDDGGDGGSGGDTGAEPDLSEAVQYAQVLEDEVNQRREENGLAALVHDDCAYDVALERAEAIRGQELAHAPLEPIFDRCPTSTVGENLARGGWSPAEAADGWMNSEGHRANILNAGFTRGAIACISEDSSYGPQMTCAHVFLG